MSNKFIVEDYTGHALDCSSMYADFIPETVFGTLTVGFRVDSDGDDVGLLISDLVYLVNYLFKGSNHPPTTAGGIASSLRSRKIVCLKELSETAEEESYDLFHES